MTWAGSVKRKFTERIQFTRNVGKNARMRSQCVPGSLKRAWVRGYSLVPRLFSALCGVSPGSVWGIS